MIHLAMNTHKNPAQAASGYLGDLQSRVEREWYPCRAVCLFIASAIILVKVDQPPSLIFGWSLVSSFTETQDIHRDHVIS